MDGYALRAADTDPPVPLALAGEVAAGEVAPEPLAPGTALGITTGAAVPAGADAILRVEHSRAAGGRVTPAAPVAPGLHVRYRGEDVRRGDVLAPTAARLGVTAVTALASAGVRAVAVHRRPLVHVLATGTELFEVGAPPEPGRVHESNRLTLQLLLADAGAEVVLHPACARRPGRDPQRDRGRAGRRRARDLGRDLMTPDVDVVVTDGFTGNVVLKTLEGGMRTLVGAILDAFGSSDDARAAADVLLPALAPLYASVDPDSTGGAMLLGVDGLCLISHGSSSADAIVNAVRVAKELAEADVVAQLRAAVK